MAKLFSGYAQARGFQQYEAPSKANKIISAGDDFVSNVRNSQKLRREQAKQQLQLLRESFQRNQDERQRQVNLAAEASQLEQDFRKSAVDQEIAALEKKGEDQLAIAESLKGISKTASDFLEGEATKRAKARQEVGMSLSLKYGLTGKEASQLAAMEGTLEDFHIAQAPVIERLRQNGATESDIQILLEQQGWTQYGIALGAVKNAESQYDNYLTNVHSEEIEFNGSSLSLAQAEDTGDLVVVQGLLEKHRSNFLQEYLPGYDQAFITKHAREGIITAESRRKRAITRRVEEEARISNEYTEKNNIVNAFRTNPTYSGVFVDYYVGQGGGPGGQYLRSSLTRNIDHFKELIETGAIPSDFARMQMEHLVKHKGQDSSKPFKDVFPLEAQIILNAADAQDSERVRASDNELRAQRRAGDNAVAMIIRDMIANPENITPQNILIAQQEVIRISGGTNLGLELSKLLNFSNEKVNDQEFDAVYGGEMAVGIFPPEQEILSFGLSTPKLQQVLQQRQAMVTNGLDDGTVKTLKKSVSNVLKQALNMESNDAIGDPSLPLAEYSAHSIALNAFAERYTGKNSIEALNYAVNKVKEQVKEGELFEIKTEATGADGRSSFKPRFVNFPGVVAPKVNPLERIDNVLTADPLAWKTTLLMDPIQAKQSAIDWNQGRFTIPRSIHRINKGLQGKVPLSEIYLEQNRIAREQDPSIPDISDSIKNTLQPVEKEFPPDLRARLQRSPNPTLVNQAMVRRGLPAQSQFGLDKGLPSFMMILESAGFPPQFIPIFAAIMIGESGGDPTEDTVKSKLDEYKINEYSIGLLQINVLAHGEKLKSLGYTEEDMRDPLKNVQVAKLVWEERIGWALEKGLSQEEAMWEALQAWSALGKRDYTNALPIAQRQWQIYQEQKNRHPNCQTNNLTDLCAQLVLKKYAGG